MPPSVVEFHPDAVEEAVAARQWYQARSASAADAFLAELDHAIEAISTHPTRWPQFVHGTRRYLFHRFPFQLVYRIVGALVQVIAVAHGRRKPGYWKTR
ncbi:MAG: type II toxin-antitoxin system RelE/ParE family toxin [Nitrospirota bacterium]